MKSKHRPRNDPKLFSNGKYPLIQTGDVSGAKFSNWEIKSFQSTYNDFGLAQSKIWEKGTLCITIAANIAECGFLGFDACFPDSVVGYVPYLGGETTSKYVLYFMLVSKENLEEFAPSTAQKNINLGILTNLLFPLPPLSEQRRIVERVERLMGWCDGLEGAMSEREGVMGKVVRAAANQVG